VIATGASIRGPTALPAAALASLVRQLTGAAARDFGNDLECRDRAPRADSGHISSLHSLRTGWND